MTNIRKRVVTKETKLNDQLLPPGLWATSGTSHEKLDLCHLCKSLIPFQYSCMKFLAMKHTSTTCILSLKIALEPWIHVYGSYRLNSSAINTRREAITVCVAGSKGMMVNTALLTPILPVVTIPEYMFTFMGQWICTCINVILNVIFTMYIHAAF